MEEKKTDRLTRELAELTAHLEVGTHRQLAILRELEPTGFWASEYARSFSEWLSWRIGLGPAAARERIRIAVALGRLPAIDAAFAQARLSYSKVRALTKVTTPANESAMLQMALDATAAQLEKICRGMRRADIQNELARDVEHRWVRQRQGDHGMVRIEAQLHPDEAAIVMQAIERARAADRTPKPDALVKVAASFEPGEPNSAKPAVEVVVHVREERLADDALGAVLEDGRRVSAETLRRIACDCSTRPVAVDAKGTPIDVGRKKRSVTVALRRALEARDRCCTFPGCGAGAWLDAHHVEHWLHGGATDLANLVLLCGFHHRLVHEGGFTMESRGRGWTFVDPSGRDVRQVPQSPRISHDVVRAMRQAYASAETRLDEYALTPPFQIHEPDYSWCVEIGLRAGAKRREDAPS